jgi:hypothetical protein
MIILHFSVVCSLSTQCSLINNQLRHLIISLLLWLMKMGIKLRIASD